EEADYERMSTGYSVVRVITGVVPLLGFLGTVIGITDAIAGLSINPEQLEASLGPVIAGLSSAFSTTALALALSIVLVFSKLVVERLEDSLLVETGRRCEQEMIGRFELFGSANDPHVASISRMCDQVVRATEVMAARQADLWQSTIDETNQRWQRATSSAGDQLTSALTDGLRTSLADHAKGVTVGVEHQLKQLNASLAGQADTLADAVASHTASVNQAVEEQLARVAEVADSQVAAVSGAVGSHLASVGDVVVNQSQAMSDAVQGNVGVLREVVERHGKQLDTGSKELLGNLRHGLERMAELLVEALERHGQTLTAAEEELASENRRHLGEVEAALGEAMVVAADRQEKLISRSEKLLAGMQAQVAESAGVTIAHQEQLVKQGEVLLKVVESTGQVKTLQDTLNSNLAALSRGHNLEETLMSLSAAIQLLSARTGRPSVDATPASNKAA
ncbi:MAG: MotA/TolQ/ExbB proton channel family protein, partial [Planctomycetota bacterium]